MILVHIFICQKQKSIPWGLDLNILKSISFSLFLFLVRAMPIVSFLWRCFNIFIHFRYLLCWSFQLLSFLSQLISNLFCWLYFWLYQCCFWLGHVLRFPELIEMLVSLWKLLTFKYKHHKNTSLTKCLVLLGW